MKADSVNYGGAIALSLIGVWSISLIVLLHLDISIQPIWLIVPAIVWQMFLYTGLFVTGHDAIHRVVYPKNQKLNDRVGSFVLFCYGFNSYQKLAKKHWLHHNHPASQIDPDFHPGQQNYPIVWYYHFMKGYFGWEQLLGFNAIFHGSKIILQIPYINLILFWLIPLGLSSIQLFYFGTFIPHLEPEGGYSNSHRARTIPRSFFWSLITCYHFGYHLEHHEHPHIPWWGLPAIVKKI